MTKKFFLTLTTAGKTLAVFRKKAGLTQSQLGEAIGATREKVAVWEAKKELVIKGEEAEAVFEGLKRVR
jgi:DNA-binding XRE family transcriptional regulator